MDYTYIENDLDISEYNLTNQELIYNNKELNHNKEELNHNNEELNYSKNENNVINIIIKIANNVFNTLGKGFVESIYHKAMLVDLHKTCYTIETKKIIPIMYNNINVGYVESDIIVYDNAHDVTVIIELKSQEKDLNNKEIIQVQKYMRNIEKQNSIGLVINFPQKTNCECIIQSKLTK